MGALKLAEEDYKREMHRKIFVNLSCDFFDDLLGVPTSDLHLRCDHGRDFSAVPISSALMHKVGEHLSQ